MPPEDPRLVGYLPLSDFAFRDTDRSSRQILDFSEKELLDFSLTPSTLAYGAVDLDDDAPTQTTVIKNIGYLDLDIINITAIGEWSLTHDCPEVLRPGQTCEIVISFVPVNAGSKTGAVYVDTGNPDNQKLILLSGTAS